MITFGGRPLNTYKIKGGSGNETRIVEVTPESVTINGPELFKPHVVEVSPELVTINKPEFVKPHVVEINPQSVTIDRPEFVKPHIVEINSESVTIDGPGLFDRPTNKNINSNVDPNKGLNPDDPFNPINVKKMNEAIKKTEFNNRLVVKLFGKEIVLTVEFIIWACGILWSLLIFTIIFSICYFLHQITQGVLDAYHTVVDGITKVMEDVNNVAIKFEVPGFDIPGLFSTGPLLKVDFKLFGGIFDNPLNDMYRASSFTRSATDLIIQIIIEMVVSIIESLPAIGEGIINAFEKVADSMN